MANEVNMEELLQQLSMQQQQGKKKWTEEIRKLIERIEKADPKDRLDYAIEFVQIFYALIFSVNGWGQWFGFKLSMQGTQGIGDDLFGSNRMTLEEYQKVYPELKKFVLEILELDFRISEAKEKELEEAAKKEEETCEHPCDKSCKKKKQKQPTYVT